MSITSQAPTSISPGGSPVGPGGGPRGDAGVSADEFRAAFRGHAAGVVIITAEAGGAPAGFTATSLASISLAPPLISFALSTGASSWPTVAAAASLVVNFLDASQHDLAGRFATSGIDRFAAPTRWSRLASGEPVLLDAPSHLRARVTQRLAVGDHHVVVARVIEVSAGAQHRPLVYHAGDYTTVGSSSGRHPR